MFKAAPSFWNINYNEYSDRNLKNDELSKLTAHFKSMCGKISGIIKSLKRNIARNAIKLEIKVGVGKFSKDNIWLGYKML